MASGVAVSPCKSFPIMAPMSLLILSVVTLSFSSHHCLWTQVQAPHHMIADVLEISGDGDESVYSREREGRGDCFSVS